MWSSGLALLSRWGGKGGAVLVHVGWMDAGIVHVNPACLLHPPPGLAVTRIEGFWKGVVRGVVKPLNFLSLVLGITSLDRSVWGRGSVSWMEFGIVWYP